MQSVRTTALAVTTAAALTLGVVATAASPATAAGAPTSAPSAATAADSATYLVLAPQGSSTARAAARVRQAGGQVVADYAAIGVLVARASRPNFEDAVAGAGVEAVAATTGLGSALEDSTEETTPAVAAAASPDSAEPLWAQQWDMRQIGVDTAHDTTLGRPDVVVGVLDSGISSTHPDLATQVDRSRSASCIGGAPDTRETAWNPTTSDHGTHVAGTIAAALNGVGMVGVAPGVKVASVKVVDDAGFIYPEAAVCGFMWAAEHGMQVTNNSYFIDPWQYNCRNDARQRPVWLAVQRAIRYSQSRGVLHVASAGNSNHDLQHKIVDTGSPNDGSSPPETRTVNGACVDLPAEAPGVVTVSATGYKRLKSYYSSYGLGVVDVAAPGGDTRTRDHTRSTITDAVLSTTYDPATRTNGWGYKQGTSMAGPHAAGVAALALSAHPGMTPGQLASYLERTATPLDCPEGVYDPRPDLPRYQATCTGGGRTSFYGAGEVDAAAAVR